MVGGDEQNLQWKRGKGGVCLLLLLHMLVNTICHFCFSLERQNNSSFCVNHYLQQISFGNFVLHVCTIILPEDINMCLFLSEILNFNG